MSAAAPGHVQSGEHAHPGPREYIRIAAILGVITAVEVGVYYSPELRPVIMPILLVLSATKFAMVVMFFMHLKFDNRIFSGLFLFGLTAAAFVITAFIVLFHFLRAPFVS